MAPEIWAGGYGKEVDIWALGALLFEMATGLPPNAASGLNVNSLGAYLKTNVPRLEGVQYSHELKDMIACCLVEDPKARLSIYELQKHPYIVKSHTTHPTSSLVDLVKAFKKWEEIGGSRKSLFMPGGAAGPQEPNEGSSDRDDWNFSTTDKFDESIGEGVDEQDIINVYGGSVNLTDWDSKTTQPTTMSESNSRRRRPPPNVLAPIKAPLEMLFDPGARTSYNYNDHSKSHYGSQSQDVSSQFSVQPQPSTATKFNKKPMSMSGLALRDDNAHSTTRESVIDLGDHDTETGMSTFHDNDTLKPLGRGAGNNSDGGVDFSRPALSDPAENINRRATQEWKFPSMPAGPVSANPDDFRFPAVQPPQVTPGAGARPALRHHPTEPISVPTQGYGALSPSGPPSPAESRASLIDLDFSMPEETQRPSTSGSSTSVDLPSAHPFHWDGHSSLMPQPRGERIPSLLLNDSHNDDGHQGNNYGASTNGLRQMLDASDFSASEVDTTDEYGSDDGQRDYGRVSQFVPQSARPMPKSLANYKPPPGVKPFPPFPRPPNVDVLLNQADQSAVAAELTRGFSDLVAHLETFKVNYSLLEPTTNRRSGGGGAGGSSDAMDGSGTNS